MKRRWLIVGSLAVLLGLRTVSLAYADDLTTSSGGTSIVEQIGCDVTTTVNGIVTINRACQVNDFINLFIYLSKWGMSILAMLSTLMLVYGGWQFITAGGRASKVDEGKRIILGTLVGTTIALTAYIIINTAFAAISGTKLASNNPFGVISTVFKDRQIIIDGQTKPLVRPFAGSTPGGGGKTPGGTTTDLPACRQPSSSWDRTCTAGNLQVYCADPATGAHPVVDIETKLEAKGFFCGGVNGCFGPNTVQCVRQFQIANCLPPTGTVDPKTEDLIDNNGTACITAALTVTQAATIAANLPATQLSTTAGDGQGCCVVKNSANDLYCVDGVTTRGCGAIGADNQFVSGKCGLAAGTVGKCGFCSNENPSSGSSSKCFYYASPHWCSGVAGGTFNFGGCDGRCATCVHSLQTK